MVLDVDDIDVHAHNILFVHFEKCRTGDNGFND